MSGFCSQGFISTAHSKACVPVDTVDTGDSMLELGMEHELRGHMMHCSSSPAQLLAATHVTGMMNPRLFTSKWFQNLDSESSGSLSAYAEMLQPLGYKLVLLSRNTLYILYETFILREDVTL